MPEALLATSAREPIKTIPLIKRLKEQRDKLADVVREIRPRMQSVYGSGKLGQNISDADWAWLKQVDAALDGVPTYAQQLRNICEGVGLNYDEVMAAALKNAPPDRTATKP
jgi:hypothetical protein